MENVDWHRFPLAAHEPVVRDWLRWLTRIGRAPNTVVAYGRALEDYLRFCATLPVDWRTATREHIGLYIQHLRTRPVPHPPRCLWTGEGPRPLLATATIQQRLTAIRLMYDLLVEAGARTHNPVGRGHYAPANWRGNPISGTSRGLLPTMHRLPWIPSEEQWQAIVVAARMEPLRNRLMLALAYDAALRREELCSLATGDIDPTYRLLHIRAETTKSRRARVVPYSVTTGRLYEAYLMHRRALSRQRGPLFLSESRRNRAVPLSYWSWSKVVQRLATAADVPAFTTHSLRHLCLTDLARAGWDLHAIAQFAGHRNPHTTLRYIHLSGRELQEKLTRDLASLHAWRLEMTVTLWT